MGKWFRNHEWNTSNKAVRNIPTQSKTPVKPIETICKQASKRSCTRSLRRMLPSKTCFFFCHLERGNVAKQKVQAINVHQLAGLAWLIVTAGLQAQCRQGWLLQFLLQNNSDQAKVSRVSAGIRTLSLFHRGSNFWQSSFPLYWVSPTQAAPSVEVVPKAPPQKAVAWEPRTAWVTTCHAAGRKFKINTMKKDEKKTRYCKIPRDTTIRTKCCMTIQTTIDYRTTVK